MRIVAFSVLLATEMLMLLSDGWLASARPLAPLYGSVIGRRTEPILTPPPSQGRIQIALPHAVAPGDA